MSSANERQVGGSHYASPIQHWDFVVANDIPYLEAQVIKYLMRWRKKNGLEDVLKAQHYLEKLIEVEKAKLPKAVTQEGLTRLVQDQPNPYTEGRPLPKRKTENTIVQDGHGFGHEEPLDYNQ